MITAMTTETNLAVIESVLIGGDLAKLVPEQRVQYYKRVCDTLGLNPLTKPFDYITLNGKLVLYASKGCAEQLRAVHGVSIVITSRETLEGVYVVTAQATLPSGRQDGATGAVSTKGLSGEALANAFMKAETKAKRRATLSICGLNMLDETEVDSIPNARIVSDKPEAGTGVTPSDAGSGYRIPFGKHAKRGLHEVEPGELASYCDYLEQKAAEQPSRPMSMDAVQFISKAREYLSFLSAEEPQSSS